MNPKIFFGLMFGLPTVLLAFIYHEVKIDNIWRLFIFCWGVAMGYMPGFMLYSYYLKDKVRKSVEGIYR